MTKQEIYKKFLKSNNYYIDFNGINYTIVDSNNKPIITLETPNEILAYIMGFNNKSKEDKLIINTLKNENATNVNRYESIIRKYETKEEGRK